MGTQEEMDWLCTSEYEESQIKTEGISCRGRKDIREINGNF